MRAVRSLSVSFPVDVSCSGIVTHTPPRAQAIRSLDDETSPWALFSPLSGTPDEGTAGARRVRSHAAQGALSEPRASAFQRSKRVATVGRSHALLQGQCEGRAVSSLLQPACFAGRRSRAAPTTLGSGRLFQGGLENGSVKGCLHASNIFNTLAACAALKRNSCRGAVSSRVCSICSSSAAALIATDGRRLRPLAPAAAITPVPPCRTGRTS